MWGIPPGSGFTAKGHLQESTQGVLVQVHPTSVSTSGERNPAVSWRASPSNIRILKEPHVAFSSKHGNCYQSILVVSGFCHVFTKYAKMDFYYGSKQFHGKTTGGQYDVVLLGSSFSGVLLKATPNFFFFFFFKHFTPERTSHLARAGFLFKSLNAFLPWHERQMFKQLC